MQITVEFTGGAELLFGNVKKHRITLSNDDNENEHPWTIKRLIGHLRDEYLRERPELFCSGDSVRPGILVLVNDTDWELLGDKDYHIKIGDQISFISTLHGG
ncbi:ubiquitin-related modifier 1 [Dermatophagoides pteronyssinus]|uniref:ubiquitin-related modifier 1 n=1 Tax=Dermatophagoides pteronyssinus TaxID=6956 RepID=UPI003F669095